jgi:hypothetical protein
VRLPDILHQGMPHPLIGRASLVTWLSAIHVLEA